MFLEILKKIENLEIIASLWSRFSYLCTNSPNKVRRALVNKLRDENLQISEHFHSEITDKMLKFKSENPAKGFLEPSFNEKETKARISIIFNGFSSLFGDLEFKLAMTVNN